MHVQFKTFRSSLSPWDDLFGKAAVFASEIGEIRLINISHSCGGNDGTVTVWYWSEDDEDAV